MGNCFRKKQQVISRDDSCEDVRRISFPVNFAATAYLQTIVDQNTTACKQRETACRQREAILESLREFKNGSPFVTMQ